MSDSDREWQLDVWDDYGFGVFILPLRAELAEDPEEGQSLEVEIDKFLKGENTFQDGHTAEVNFELSMFSKDGEQTVIASRVSKVEMLFDEHARKITLRGKFTKVHRWGL